MRIVLQILTAAVLASALTPTFANGGGEMPAMPQPTPQQKARDVYNDGIRAVGKADKAQEAAAQASDASRKERAAKEAREHYGAALAKFQEATRLDPTLPEAWNYLGYSSRKLGHYDDALAAYGKALALRPGYADALEYRGEAYLGLHRIPDAQQAYLDLYAGNRALAGKLLTAMKSWVAEQRTGSASGDAANLDDFEKWIQERAQIAAQTAALTRAGAAASWR
jgi:tetratricopeptide (TPR) repeat protein